MIKCSVCKEVKARKDIRCFVLALGGVVCKDCRAVQLKKKRSLQRKAERGEVVSVEKLPHDECFVKPTIKYNHCSACNSLTHNRFMCSGCLSVATGNFEGNYVYG